MTPKREQGAALVSVLLFTLVAAVMFAGLMTVSISSTRAAAAEVAQTQAMADARSALMAAYQHLLQTWQSDGGNRTFTTTADLQSALNRLKSDMGVAYTGYPGVSVSIQWTDIQGSESSGGPVGEQITFVATARRGTVTESMQSTTAITSTPEAFNYALYSTGNMTIDGPVKIVGNGAVQSNLYVNAQPWVTNYDANYDGRPGSSYLKATLLWDGLLDTVQLTMGVINVAESALDEPSARPTVSGGTLYVGHSVYQWSNFSDAGTHSGKYTTQMGNTGAYSGLATVGTSQLPSMVAGGVQLSTQPPAFSTDVIALVETMNPTMLSAAKQVAVHQAGWSDNLPNTVGGYYAPTATGEYDVAPGTTTTVSQSTYIDGDLNVPESSILQVNAPLFVNGDLVVSGTLEANAAIYVRQRTYYEPVDAFQDGGIWSWFNPGKGMAPRLLIFSEGSLFLSMHPDPVGDFFTFLTSGQVSAPQKPLVMHAFLMSGDTVYVDGTQACYDIKGGIAGKNVVLLTIPGAKQHLQIVGTDDYGTSIAGLPLGWPVYKWVSDDFGDTTPRLTIEYDGSYATQPLAGMPQVLTVTVQPLSSPQWIGGT